MTGVEISNKGFLVPSGDRFWYGHVLGETLPALVEDREALVDPELRRSRVLEFEELRAPVAKLWLVCMFQPLFDSEQPDVSALTMADLMGPPQYMGSASVKRQSHSRVRPKRPPTHEALQEIVDNSFFQSTTYRVTYEKQGYKRTRGAIFDA